MKQKLFILLLFVLCFPKKDIMAHQPKYEDMNTEITVSEPEISKAFYGIMHGFPVTFTVESPKSFSLYINVLVPDLKDARTDLQMVITGPKNIMIDTMRKGDAWEKYYEKFARDWYLKGPEYKKILPAGTYTLVLSNTNNQGKYVVAIGEKESFPPSIFPTLFLNLMKIKTTIFEKPWYSAFTNIFGYSLLGILTFLFLGSAIITYFIRKFSRLNKP